MIIMACASFLSLVFLFILLYNSSKLGGLGLGGSSVSELALGKPIFPFPPLFFLDLKILLNLSAAEEDLLRCFRCFGEFVVGEESFESSPLYRVKSGFISMSFTVL